uniref:NAC domain protein NAC72 n=1 Tax=Gossypium hirsutum TaxID=3635 RepID=W6JBB2_GOSHI|nr:NAC domain protein NAC72 [Gossypium hirsutum]
MSDNQVFMDPVMLMEEKDEACLRSIPPGYRFKPRDDEIINFYLRPKIFGLPLPPNRIKEVLLYNYDPQTLTGTHDEQQCTLKWGWKRILFLHAKRSKIRKWFEANAGNGYWKATGADKLICRKGKKIGLKKSLVFYQGKPPKGVKTNWLMHEYVLTDAPIRKRLGNEDMRLDDWVLCRVYKNPRVKKLEHETLEDGNQEEADTATTVAYDGAQMVQQEGHQVECEAEAARSAIPPYNGIQMVENGIAFATLYEPINTSSQMLEHGIAPLYEPINTSSQMLENGIAFAPLYEPINVQMPQGTSSWFPEQVYSTPYFNQYGDYTFEHPTLEGFNMPDCGVYDPALFQINMQQHFSSDFDLDQLNQDPHSGLPPPL